MVGTRMMDTLREALDRLSTAGFVDDLVAIDGGLRGASSHVRFDPQDLVVVEVVRFEGASDPDDEAIVFALADPEGAPLGTYTVPYGPETSDADAEVVTHLTRRATA